MSRSSLTEQWFLNLDGIRSGPYQTSEILSLIAEGEILPHHRIAANLKSRDWISILDWRLDQARAVKPSKKPEVSEIVPFKEKNEPQVEMVVPKRVEDPGPAETSENLYQELSGFTEISTGLAEPEPEAKAEPEREEEIQAQPAEPQTDPSPPAAPPGNTPSPKRDPVAEMFDMLQNNKSKRDEKTKQSAIAHQNTQSAQAKSNQKNSTEQQPSPSSTTAVLAQYKGVAKSMFMGLTITVLGYVFGQMFQQHILPAPSAEKPHATTQSTALAPTPASVVVETVDRSNEKMIIRSKVEHKAETAKSGQPLPTEKDLQELKELKRELQELKALKDELKNNPNANPSYNRDEDSDSMYGNDGGSNPGYNYPNNNGNSGPSGGDIQVAPR